MDVVHRFVDHQKEVRSLIKQNKVDEAKSKFHGLVEVYNELANADIEHYHKEIAHQELTNLHSELNDAKQSLKVPVKIVVAGFLLVLFSFLVFLNPSIVGLITFEDEVVQPVDITFTESKIQSITLKGVPLSLSASGTYDGDVKLFFKNGNDLVLIFDSSKVDGEEFSRVCVDTCEIKADSNSVELFAQIGDNSSLTLSEVIYTTPRDNNRAPKWVGKNKVFHVDGQTTIDLGKLFKDPDGDDLVFLSTSDDNLKVVVQNHLVKVQSDGTKGERTITFIASDLDKLSKVPVKIVVK